MTGLGGFVEVQWKDAFYMDNANFLKAPGYELVNVNLHYKTDLGSDYFKRLNLFFEVRTCSTGPMSHLPTTSRTR